MSETPEPWYTEEQVELATHVIPTDLIGNGIHARCLVRDILNRVRPPGEARVLDEDEIAVPAVLVENISNLTNRLTENTSVLTFASDVTELCNEVAQLETWHPRFDHERGEITEEYAGS